MPRLERMPEVVPGPFTLDAVDERTRAGWKLAAVEWTRQVEGEPDGTEPAARVEELPYGSRVAADCVHLEENPTEMEILT